MRSSLQWSLPPLADLPRLISIMASSAKRTMDIVVAVLGLAFLAPLLAVVAIIVKLDSPGPVFFRQDRVGRRFVTFSIFKFRTMYTDVDDALSTGSTDTRVTRVGHWLRRTKIDELPQLLNVALGHMSLVGPRPELRRFVDLYRSDYETLLTVRPGITDLASLEYRNESSLLVGIADPETRYVTQLLPRKIFLGHEYVRRSSLAFDFVLLGRTLLSLFNSNRRPDTESS